MEPRESHPIPQETPKASGLGDVLAGGLEGSCADLLLLVNGVIDQSPSPIWIADAEGTVIRVNQACCDTFGVRADEVIGRFNVLRDPAVQRFGLMASLGRAFDSGDTVRFDHDYDGSWLPGLPVDPSVRLHLLTTVLPLNDSTGRLSGVIVQHVDLTGQKAAQEALRLSETRLIQAQAIAHVGNWEIDLATGTMWGSEEAFRIYGADRVSSTVPLAAAQGYVVASDRPRLDAALETLVKKGGPYDLEFRITRPNDGALRVIHSIAELVRDASGKPSKVIGVIQDVTEQRQVEERLRLTEYSVDHALDSIFWTDADGRFVWVNDSTCRTLGYLREELIGMTIFEVEHRLTSTTWATGWQRMKEQGPFTFETVLTTKDGTSLPIEVNASYVDYGGVQYACAFARDLTERKRSEENALWLSRILDESLNEVYVFDSETLHFVQVNRGAQRNLGYTMDELARMTPLDLKPAFTREDFERLIAPLRSGAERQVVFETEHRRKDGSHYPVEVHLQITAREPRPMFLAIILDISTRKAAEDALRLSEEQLRQSQKMEAIGLLAGGIAHDFNNLLTAIIGYTDLLRTRVPDDGRSRTDLEEIRHAAERASSLSRQILAFSRRQALQPRVASLNEVLTGLEPLLRRTLGEDIDLVTAQDPDLGLVRVDVHQFEQVLLNLAVNARDAMPSGGRLTLETGNVEVDADFALAHPEMTPGSYVTLAARDTGHGMDEQTMARVYEPFFTTKTPGKGTGLGLSMVYGIVRQSGGTILVESRVGGGSCFTVYLPRVFGSQPDIEGGNTEMTESDHGGETILVVEDEPALRRLASRILGQLGYEVYVAGSADEALKVLGLMARSPDLLLTDMTLPGGMQGRDLADSLWPDYPETKVLFMSGYAPDAVVPMGREGREAHFLQKPFTPEQLAIAVRRALNTPRR
jgi:PAS domain S-box-containing protein